MVAEPETLAADTKNGLCISHTNGIDPKSAGWYVSIMNRAQKLSKDSSVIIESDLSYTIVRRTPNAIIANVWKQS